MVNGATKILIATFFPTLSKGALEILAGILKTFNVLGQTEVAIFSFYPTLDAKRYPSGIRLVDIGKDLHVEKLFRSSREREREKKIRAC